MLANTNRHSLVGYVYSNEVYIMPSCSKSHQQKSTGAKTTEETYLGGIGHNTTYFMDQIEKQCNSHLLNLCWCTSEKLLIDVQERVRDQMEANRRFGWMDGVERSFFFSSELQRGVSSSLQSFRGEFLLLRASEGSWIAGVGGGWKEREREGEITPYPPPYPARPDASLSRRGFMVLYVWHFDPVGTLFKLSRPLDTHSTDASEIVK